MADDAPPDVPTEEAAAPEGNPEGVASDQAPGDATAEAAEVPAEVAAVEEAPAVATSAEAPAVQEEQAPEAAAPPAEQPADAAAEPPAAAAEEPPAEATIEAEEATAEVAEAAPPAGETAAEAEAEAEAAPEAVAATAAVEAEPVAAAATAAEATEAAAASQDEAAVAPPAEASASQDAPPAGEESAVTAAPAAKQEDAAEGEGENEEGEEAEAEEEVEFGRQASKTILERKRSKPLNFEGVHDDAEEKEHAEEDKWKMPESFFYDEAAPELKRPLEDQQLPRKITKIERHIGFDFHRHYNLVWVSDEEYAYIIGHVVRIVNINTDSQRFIHSRDSGGIGSVAVSIDQQWIALAERSISGQPNIYVYKNDPTLQLYRVLRKGTERGYAACKFSPHNPDHLAALGQSPDYLLSVWDWKNERLLLKCKAYGQEIFDVRWGQFPGMLMTCGTGHIRFWKMALTFTGLKLQGDLGKFGASELSDIAGFVELPDGKVVTGSQYGKLLLWEGVFVKVEILRCASGDRAGIGQGSSNAHEGNIDVIIYDKREDCIVSGGDDGYLRWWPVNEIDEGEADYDNGILEYGVTLKREVRIGIPSEDGNFFPANIQHVARSENDDTWLIQDVRNGVVWRFDRNEGELVEIFHANCKAVTGTLVSDQYPGLVITSGADGSLRAFNITAEDNQELFVDRRSGGAITGMAAAPESVDQEQRTITCGYEDGVLRTFALCSNGFMLLQATKPHNCAIQQVAYSRDGTFFATLGEDSTIFFFEVTDRENHLKPLGFAEISGKVNHMSWSYSNGGSVVLAMEDGSIVELVRPNPSNVDSADTYFITLDYRCVQPVLPEPEEEEEEEEEAGEEELDEEAAAAAAAAAEADPSMEPLETPKKKKKEKQEDVRKPADDDAPEPEVQSAVMQVLAMTEEKVIFTGTGKYAGGLWELSMEASSLYSQAVTPIGTAEAAATDATLLTKLPTNTQVTYLRQSPGDRVIFVGFQDGRVWLLPTSNMAYKAAVEVADSTSGPILSISSNTEEHVLVVGSGDGGLSMVNLNVDGLQAAADVLAKSPTLNEEEVDAQAELFSTYYPIHPADMTAWELPEVESSVSVAKDITEPDAYSIQEAKMKSEEENAKAAAERQKRRVQDRIAEVRKELEELQKKNDAIPYGKLSRDELTIDPEYIQELHQDMENRIEDVNREMAWTIEFHERGLQKIKDYFLGKLDFERIEVLAFASPHRVATFRCAAMSEELQTNLAKLHELIFAADRENEEDDDDLDGGTGDQGSKSNFSPDAQSMRTGLGFGEIGFDGSGGGESGSGRGDGRNLTGAEQREIRRQQRQERKQQMTDLEKAKPSDSYEDPRDVEAIAHAEATLGNYTLKTSSSYQVPENQRMNAEKKRRQMFLLEESMHAIKTEFNNRVLALRDFRQQVRQEINRDNEMLQEIDEKLGTATDWVSELLKEDPLAPVEFPEKRFDYTEADLKAFRRQLRDSAGDDQDALDGREDDEDDDEADGTGAGDDGAAEDGGAGPRKMSAKDDSQAAVLAASRGLAGRRVVAAKRSDRLALRAQVLQARAERADPLGKEVAKEAEARLWHDKAQLEEHVRQVVETFDGAVASIEKEKAKLESDLKNAGMKLLVLHEELLTLNELEEKDEALLKKATKCRQDKTNIMHQIKECQDLLSEKKAEIEQWQTEEANLQAEFTELVGENSPFLSALLKIYKKKVKRSKRKKGQLGDDEDFDDEDEDDEDESDLESDEEDDDMDEDTGPPPGCDVQIYESVIDLREKRLDMEDALQEIQKAVDDLKKTHQKLLTDEKKVDKEQKQTDTEIQQFQTDKQRKLNQVKIVFALRLSQVQCLETEDDDGHRRLPSELDEQVVFTKEGLHRLMSRITEIHHEIKDVRNNHRLLQRDFRVRKKEKKSAMETIGDLQSKFEDIQMLKFGQTVDLDLIERSAPNKYVQELQEKVLDAEKDHRQTLARWEKMIESSKKELARVTQENTSLMEQIVSMGYSQMQLDAALNARISNVTVNDTEPLNEVRELERERLKDLVMLQQKEIATLQAEINLFRKKGGHIYTTVTANRMPERA